MALMLTEDTLKELLDVMCKHINGFPNGFHLTPAELLERVLIDANKDHADVYRLQVKCGEILPMNEPNEFSHPIPRREVECAECGGVIAQHQFRPDGHKWVEPVPPKLGE